MGKWCVVAVVLAALSVVQAGPSGTTPGSSQGSGARSIDHLTPPLPEVENAAPVDLPAVPDFALPAPSPSGAHSVRELRVAGRSLFGTQLAVEGVITWAYDCVADIKKKGESLRHVHARIDRDPTLCERPKFYVGDTRDTPPEKSLWVVDVPRPWNKLEVGRIPKADRNEPDRCEPNDPHPARLVCPPYHPGDHVLVVGTFDLRSPHDEANSDGLLVYHAMKNATRSWETTGGANVPANSQPASPVKPLPTALPRSKLAPQAAVSRLHNNASRALLAKGNREFAARHYDEAGIDYQRALIQWEANHLAWYGLGGSYAARGLWRPASEALRHATELAPDDGMYQMWYGVALYEAAVSDARIEQAKKRGRAPETIRPDLTQLDFTLAAGYLAEAVRTTPGLWRAHYYLGRIFRAHGEAKRAADQFSLAIVTNPTEQGPFVALGELYRKWDYTNEAIAVTTVGTTHASFDVSDIWYVLGMSYDDKRAYTQAIAAYSKALEVDPHNAKALFQRGQAYFRKHRRARARRDLEAFVKTNSPWSFARTQANNMLRDLENAPGH